MKEKISLILLVAFIIVGLAIVVVKQIKFSPANSSIINSISTTSPQTSLSVSQDPIAISTPSGSFYKVNVLINSQSNNITAAQLELSFDPKVLSNVDIQPGTFIQNPDVLLKNIDMENGRISFALSPNTEQGSVTGQGTLAVVIFSLKTNIFSPITTTISFQPKTEIRAEGALGSVLKSSTAATIALSPRLSPTPILLFIQNSSRAASTPGL